MLETIREYGAERLAERGEVGELRRRHAAHYSALMAEAEPLLLTRDQVTWLARLQAERDNILAALRYWCDARGRGERAHPGGRRSASWRCCSATTRTWRSGSGEALAVPGQADPGLRTIAEALTSGRHDRPGPRPGGTPTPSPTLRSGRAP